MHGHEPDLHSLSPLRANHLPARVSGCSPHVHRHESHGVVAEDVYDRHGDGPAPFKFQQLLSAGEPKALAEFQALNTAITPPRGRWRET